MPQNIIANAIEKKSKELTRYKGAAGLDMRLLPVADRVLNSGKLLLEERTVFGFLGFQVVYFFPYPESAVILDNAASGDT
jgi:hypothetical protein